MARRRNTQQMMSVQPLESKGQCQGGSLGVLGIIIHCTLLTYIHVLFGHLSLSESTHAF